MDIKKYNMKNIWISLTVVCQILISCTNSSSVNKILRDENVAIKVDLKSISDNSIYDYFSKIEIIPLETTKESILNPSFLKLLVFEDYIYVGDYKNNSVCIFNKNGKFIKRVDKLGRGPGEYFSLSDYIINKTTRRLELLAPNGNVYSYDLLGDVFYEQFSLPADILSVYSFQNITDDLYVFFSIFGDKQLIFFSKNKSSVLKVMKVKPEFLLTKTTMHFSITPFYEFAGDVMYFEGDNGNLFSVDTTNISIKPKLQFDFGKYNFDYTLLSPNETHEYYIKYSRTASTKYVIEIFPFGETNEFIIANYKFKNAIYTLFYSKASKSVKIFSKTKEGLIFTPSRASNDSAMFFYSTPNRLRKYVNEKVLDIDNINKLNQITENDNIVVIKYTNNKNE